MAKAKSIHDLMGDVYVPNASKPWDEKRDLLAEKKAREHWRIPVPVAPEFLPYYGSRMHDSWPIEVERTPQVFRLSLDSIDGGHFAAVLADLVGIEGMNLVMPVDLLLHHPTYVRAARYGIRGELRFEEWEKIGKPVGEHERGYQFLSDRFHEQDGRVQWIAEIWGGNHWQGKMSPSLYLMVDATHATAADRRRSVLEKALGPAAGQLWQDALEEERYLYSGGDMEDFLVRRMGHYGMTAGDFRVRVG